MSLFLTNAAVLGAVNLHFHTSKSGVTVRYSSLCLSSFKMTGSILIAMLMVKLASGVHRCDLSGFLCLTEHFGNCMFTLAADLGSEVRWRSLIMNHNKAERSSPTCTASTGYSCPRKKKKNSWCHIFSLAPIPHLDWSVRLVSYLPSDPILLQWLSDYTLSSHWLQDQLSSVHATCSPVLLCAMQLQLV